MEEKMKAIKIKIVIKRKGRKCIFYNTIFLNSSWFFWEASLLIKLFRIHGRLWVNSLQEITIENGNPLFSSEVNDRIEIIEK